MHLYEWDLRPGMIGLSPADDTPLANLIARLQRLARRDSSNTRCVHAFLVLDGDDILSTGNGGVSYKDFLGDDDFHTPPGTVFIDPLFGMPDEYRRRVVKVADEHLGSRYSIAAVVLCFIYGVLGRPWWLRVLAPKTGDRFCSGLMASIYAEAGLALTTEPPAFVTPSDLADIYLIEEPS